MLSTQDIESKKFQDKYSRQVATMGMEAMSKLIQMNVAVIGQQGPGVEAAKNTILGGANSVTLVDDAPVKMTDLSANFYFTE